MKDYDLCKTCGHTPAFCHCRFIGMSRAEWNRRQQEIIEESIFEDPEMQQAMMQEMFKLLELESKNE